MFANYLNGVFSLHARIRPEKVTWKHIKKLKDYAFAKIFPVG